MSRSGAIPSPRNAFAEGLCTTLTPRSAITARSSWSTHTQCTIRVAGDSTSSESRNRTGDSPFVDIDWSYS